MLDLTANDNSSKHIQPSSYVTGSRKYTIRLLTSTLHFTVIYNGIRLLKVWVVVEHAQTVDTELSFPRSPQKKKKSLGQEARVAWLATIKQDMPDLISSFGIYVFWLIEHNARYVDVS